MLRAVCRRQLSFLYKLFYAIFTLDIFQSRMNLTMTTLYILIIVTSRFYRASACYVCRARYCFTNSICLCAQCQYVPMEMNILSHFLTFWYGKHSSFCASPLSKIPTGTSLAESVNTRGGIFLHCLTEILLFISETVRDKPIVAIER